MDAQRQAQVSVAKPDTVGQWSNWTLFLSSDQDHAEAMGGNPGHRHPDAGVRRPHAAGGL